MTTRAEPFDSAFGEWMDAREPELRRLAHLLCGDLDVARARVVDALATALSVHHADHAEGADLDAAAEHALVAAVVSGRPSRAVPAWTGVEVAYDPDEDDQVDERHRAVWGQLAGLTPVGRAALVLGRYRGLEVDEVAELLGTTPARAEAETGAALAGATELLGSSRAEAESVVDTTLRVRAATTPYSPTPVAAVRESVHRAGGRRARTSLAALAAAGAVATAAVVAVIGAGPAGPVRPHPGTPSPIANFEPGRDQVPPPWVLLPGNRSLRVGLETRCTLGMDEDYRSNTMIRARCRTVVVPR
jgi:DNA-directed RNA polymerase specialized sigma24 family protein